MASSTSQSDIEDVMKRCGCGRREALNLLRHSNNDPRQAQLRHQMRLQFGWAPPASVTSPSQKPDKSTANSQKLDSVSDSDGYDVISPQFDRETFPTRTRSPHTPDHNKFGTHPAKQSTPEFYYDDRYDQKSNIRPRDYFDPASGAFFTQPSNDYDRHFPDWSRSIASKIESDRSRVDTTLDNPSNEHGLDTTPHEIAHVDEAESISVRSSSPALIKKVEWDFVLPSIPPDSQSVSGKNIQRLNAHQMVAMLRSNPAERALQTYLEYHDKNAILSHINQEVAGFPTIFYAAATNNDRLLRTWIAHGANANAVHEESGTPLLAFAIVHGEIIEEDTTDIVASLLSLGASASAIPESFYKPYCTDLPEEGPDDEEESDTSEQDQFRWLTSTSKKRLAQNLNLTHRYNLERALRTPKPSLRHKQVAERYRAEGLLGLPYFLIGQSLASTRLLQTCINYLANRTQKAKPLVMVFAGPSGHGKTEMARRLGYLMSLELEVVDCTIVNREIELFGGRHPYINAGEGTPLNNFLARHSGQRCIVFMDEFEKTTKEIHQALLLPFDNGEYQDRRTLKMVDCSKTIWILATNALDTRIRNFCKTNEAVLFNDDEDDTRKRLMKDLDKDLKNDFLSKFDAPITGRISAFLPFLLFSPSEQAVIAHKYLLELGKDVRKPVNLTIGPEERLIGNVRLHIKRDASVCSHLANEGYFPDLGARSLITTVDSVRHSLVNTYLEVDEAIREAAELVDFEVDIRGGNITTEMTS